MRAAASKIKLAVDFEFSLACIHVPKLIALHACVRNEAVSSYINCCQKLELMERC